MFLPNQSTKEKEKKKRKRKKLLALSKDIAAHLIIVLHH